MAAARDRQSQSTASCLTHPSPACSLSALLRIPSNKTEIIIYNKHSSCLLLFTAIFTDFSGTFYHVSDFPKYQSTIGKQALPFLTRYFCGAETEQRAPRGPGKCSTPELHPRPRAPHSIRLTWELSASASASS